MKSVAVNKTETYKKSLEDLDNEVKKRVERKVEGLKGNPELGKPQKYISGLWALHIGKYRVFYTYSKESVDILLVWVLDIFHKKELDGHYPKVFGELRKLIDKIKEIKTK